MTIAVGQIVRDRTCSAFRIGIVIGPSNRPGKFRVCRWQRAGFGYWSAPVVLAEAQLEPITMSSSSVTIDLANRFGLSAARRATADGVVRWKVGGPDGLTEIANVGQVKP